jgi:hypothetical protein
MTIADTLYDAANEIRGYIEDDMVPSDKEAAEITHVVMMMDALREKIDAMGLNRLIASEREYLAKALKDDIPF